MKRVKRLYIPFLKWAIPFLILHNTFFYFNIYNNLYGFYGNIEERYSIAMMLKKLLCIILFLDTPTLLLGAMWFVKYLFFASITVAAITLLLKPTRTIAQLSLLATLFTGSLITDYFHIDLFVIPLRDLLWAMTFFYTGHLIRNIKDSKYIICTALAIFLAINRFLLKLDFFASGYVMVLAYASALCGSVLLLKFSSIINGVKLIRTPLYYIGNHTFAILVLHFLCFKVVNLLLIYIYRLPMERLAELPIMNGYSKFWILYTIAGVGLPLLCTFVYDKCVNGYRKAFATGK